MVLAVRPMLLDVLSILWHTQRSNYDFCISKLQLNATLHAKIPGIAKLFSNLGIM